MCENHFKRCHEKIFDIHHLLIWEREEDRKIHELASEISVKIEDILYHMLMHKSFIETHKLDESWKHFKRNYIPADNDCYEKKCRIIDGWLNSM